MEAITLEQMYYIGEIISAIVVIASLLYVGKQLHQNTQQLRVSVSTAYARYITDIQSQLTHDREFTEVWSKGESDFENLDEVDKTRLISLEFIALHNWFFYFGLHQQNLLPDREWHQQTWAMKHFGKR